MRKATLFATLLLTTVAFVSSIEAKTRDKSWEFGASAVHFDTAFDAGVDNSVGPELRFGYNFSSKVGTEVQLSSTSTEHDGEDDDFVRAVGVIVGNFLTDRDTKTVPFVLAGVGVIQETRKAFTDGSGVEVAESFDSSALLSIGVGARTFFTDNWGIRYEVRYNHHDSFTKGQDEYLAAIGISWVVGGQK